MLALDVLFQQFLRLCSYFFDSYLELLLISILD